MKGLSEGGLRMVTKSNGEGQTVAIFFPWMVRGGNELAPGE